MHHTARSVAGQASTRSIIVVLAAILISAIGIIIVIVLLESRRETTAPPVEMRDGQDRTGADAEKEDQTADDPESQAQTITYTGRISSIKDGIIAIQTDGQNLIITVTEKTEVYFQGNPFPLSELTQNDTIEVLAEKTRQKGLLAIRITLLVSTSPNVPSPINPNPQVDESGAPIPPSQRRAL